MIRLGKYFSLTILLWLLAVATATRAATNSTPDFKEVYESIRTHVVGMDAAQLNQAAVSGLLNELGPRAALVSSTPATNPPVVTRLLSRTWEFEGGLAYVRVAQIGEGLAAEVRTTIQATVTSNRLQGVVLDLRFADGDDYAATIAVAELFALKKSAALDWGKARLEAKTGNEIFSVPLVVLVNGETHAAAEALAALLKESGAGLILGNQTAGHALLTEDFPLSNGGILRVATAAVKLNGEQLTRVRPDIAVDINLRDEQVFFAEAFKVFPDTNAPVAISKLAGTNIPVRRVRLTEASLVRAHKQGLNPEEDEAGLVNLPHETKPEIPVMKDPTLARALDLLRGLAIVRPARP